MFAPKAKPTVMVAMSGGVDSSVACHLLLKAGYRVKGATIRTWDANGCESQNARACCARDGIEDARRVAHQLGIPYYVFNFQREFQSSVIDYFVEDYKKGRTPNPCVACNNHVKFRLFLKRARALGADYMATGHYAQIHHDESSGRYLLSEGVDASKDQSYVLFGLDQDTLARALLPLGKFQKDEIRVMADELGLCNAQKPDSMEICFVPGNDYRSFLKKHGHVLDQTGVIRDTGGKKLGAHQGYFHFTIGQRRGLGLAHAEPLYVKELRPETNEVIVGTKAEVFGTMFLVTDVNWMAKLNGVSTYYFDVKVRSRHPKAPAVVERTGVSEARVSFAEPQDAITPGQAAVFYDGTTVMGGGWIAGRAA